MSDLFGNHIVCFPMRRLIYAYFGTLLVTCIHSIHSLTLSSALENFIRAKYETKKYIAKEWVQPKPTVPKEV